MEVTAYFDRNTKRFHRFLIDEKEIKGTIYFSLGGDKIPDKITVSLETSRERTGD